MRRREYPHGPLRYRHGPDENGTPGKGCHCPVCTDGKRRYEAHRARMIAYGRWEPTADATGTRRRIQALMRNGWSAARLAARLGMSREFEAILRVRGVVKVSTAKAVAALYDELWDQQAPCLERYDRASSTRARNRAVKAGWPPPAAWDDEGPHCIDDPDARSAEGWERRGGVRRYGVLAEEAAELAGHGEIPEMIAARLVASLASVERTLSRAAAKEAA